MSLDNMTDKVKSLASEKGGAINAKIKFQFEEGHIYLDDTTSPTLVSNENNPADCTVKVSLSNFEKLIKGEMNAMGAFMLGKLKVEGDMSVAMKLSSLF
ncbi:MAG: SCP2 sterol-binding domain-containing protein [Cyclobacteriaceae bacterium]